VPNTQVLQEYLQNDITKFQQALEPLGQYGEFRQLKKPSVVVPMTFLIGSKE